MCETRFDLLTPFILQRYGETQMYFFTRYA
jgi:hypothetical protein